MDCRVLLQQLIKYIRIIGITESY